MEFEYFEYEFPKDGAGKGRRVSSLLAEHGYQSLQRESLDLVQRYLPAGTGQVHTGPPTGARTVDVLIPPADSAARILVCERPAAGSSGGVAVAVVAVASSQEDAHRSRTAARMALDTKGAREDALAASVASDNGRSRVRRFRQEWVRSLGLEPSDGGGETAPSAVPKSLAAGEALFALHDAPGVLGRPAVLRSRLDKGGDVRPGTDPGLLDGLVAEGLVDRSFVLVCRDSGRIVGVGKDAAEVQAAKQIALRCPHCRRPLGDELQDVLYSLSTQGEEVIRGSRWIRAAVESALRKRSCDAVVLADGANGRAVDGAACYQDAVLLFRLKDGEPASNDVQTFRQTLVEFEKTAPGVLVRGVYVAAKPAPSTDAVSKANGRATCTVLEISRLEAGLDRLLEDVKRDNFMRLTGTALDLVRPNPSSLLTPGPA